MPYLTLLFWLALGVPGFAVLCHVDRAELKSGLLGVIGLSYLATLAILSPISILAYVFHWPLAVFSGACVLAILVGLVEILRHGWWRQASRVLVGALGFEILLVLADCIIGGRVGAITSADAELHLARIRCLMDHGFSNHDPMLSGEVFFPIYHTNILHALHAAGAQLFRTDGWVVWWASLPWAKVLAASGSYYLAWCVFRRRWAAWVAALFILTSQAPITYLVYPNNLAPLWLLPILLGFTLQVCRRHFKGHDIFKLTAGVVVLGQVHALYVVFVLLSAGPVLVIWGLARFLRQRRERWRIAACAVGLSLALPFPLLARNTKESSPQTSSSVAALPAAKPTAVNSAASEPGFRRLSNGWIMMNPHTNLGGFAGWRAGFLLTGATCLVVGRRRRSVVMLILMLLSAGACFFIPPLCTFLVRTLGAGWMLNRMQMVLRVGFIALVPAAAAYLLEYLVAWAVARPLDRRIWYRLARSALGATVPLAALQFSHYSKPYDWSNYWETAKKPAPLRLQSLDTYAKMRSFLRDHIPPGETVLASSIFGPRIVLLYDCHLVTAQRGHNGLPGQQVYRRRADLAAMLQADTPWEARREFLRKYGIRFVIANFMQVDWMRDHIHQDLRGPSLRIMELSF